jgi:predicted amidohydrolase YtcJ
MTAAAIDRMFVHGRFAPWLTGSLGPVDAIGVRDGVVVAVGRHDELAKRTAQPADVIDLGGRFVTPGIVDSHTHLALFGLKGTLELDLAGADDGRDVLDLVAASAITRVEGAWIRGSGLVPTADDGRVDRLALDQVAPNRPVVLIHETGHQAVANSAALAAAGIADDTPNPDGGRIDRDELGAATGWLREFAAMMLVTDRLPPVSDAEWDRAILWSQARYLEAGVTSCKESYGGSDHRGVLASYRRLAGEGRLTIRPTVLRQVATVDAVRDVDDLMRTAEPDGAVRQPGIKVFLDGSIVARTAWLRAPYPGDAGAGGPRLDPAIFRSIVAEAAVRNIDIAVHAIGDAAVDEVAHAFDVTRQGCRKASRRTATRPVAVRSVVHGFLASRAALASLARSGAVLETQPVLLDRLRTGYARALDPERLGRLMPLRSAVDAGMCLGAGSDAPTSAPDVGRGIAAASERSGTNDHGRIYLAAERLTRREALVAYTLGAARCLGLAGRIGTLAPSARADLVAWDTDLLTASADEVADARPVMTVVGGEVAWAGGSA